MDNRHRVTKKAKAELFDLIMMRVIAAERRIKTRFPADCDDIKTNAYDSTLALLREHGWLTKENG